METAPIHNLFTLEQLQDYQQAGKWPLADSTLLSTKYADRWEVADRFATLTSEFNSTSWFNLLKCGHSPTVYIFDPAARSVFLPDTTTCPWPILRLVMTLHQT